MRRLTFLASVLGIAFGASSAMGASGVPPSSCSLAQFMAVPEQCTLNPWPDCTVTCVDGSPGHPTQNTVLLVDTINATTVTDKGGWLYDKNNADASYGQVKVNCAHPSMRRSIWYTK